MLFRYKKEKLLITYKVLAQRFKLNEKHHISRFSEMEKKYADKEIQAYSTLLL